MLALLDLPAARLHLLVGLVLLTGCVACSSERGDTQTSLEQQIEQRCAVDPPTKCPESPPVYADVAPLIDRTCNSCHTPDDPEGPWPLVSYSHIVAWGSLVRDELLQCTMPPLDDDVDFSPEDRLLLMTWVRCGFPEE